MSIWTVDDDLKDELEFQNEQIVELRKKYGITDALWNLYSTKLMMFLYVNLPLMHVICEDKEMIYCADSVLGSLDVFFKELDDICNEGENKGATYERNETINP